MRVLVGGHSTSVTSISISNVYKAVSVELESEIDCSGRPLTELVVK